jgi:hypothetical protein
LRGPGWANNFQQGLGNDQPTVAIHRDPFGRIVREQFSKYLQRTSDYDVNGLPQELTRPNGDIDWSAAYDALGRVQKL